MAIRSSAACAWPNVSAAIAGASRPEQIRANAKAAGLKLEDTLMKQIDEILDPVIERDPKKIDSCHTRP